MKERSQNFLLNFLRKLRNAGIHYRLDSTHEDSIMIEVAVPGERWEIEIMENGEFEIERFKSDGSIHGEAALDELFAKFAD
jgi:hypothetical protein